MPATLLPASHPLHLLPCFARFFPAPLSGSLALSPPPSCVLSLLGFLGCFAPCEVQSLLLIALPASPSRYPQRPALAGFSAALLSSSSAPYLPLSVRTL